MARQAAVLLLAAVAATVLTHYLAEQSIEMAWTVALMVPLVALIIVLLELFSFQKSVVGQAAPKPLVQVLSETVARLPETEDALKHRLRELLIRRLAARTGLTVAEVETRAFELVKDEQLVKLLKGEARLRSEREVLDLLKRIDEL